MRFTLTVCPECGTALNPSDKKCQFCDCNEIKDWGKFFVLSNFILLLMVLFLLLLFTL